LVGTGVAVTGASGIFGGLTAVVGSGGTGVEVAGGVVGVGVVAAGGTVVGAAVVGGGAWATVALTWRLVVGLVSAAYAAVAAPRTSSPVAMSRTAGTRQPEARVVRLPGAGVPHCRHHSCAGSIEAPHFLQVRAVLGAGASAAGAAPEDSGGSGG
jgi:hypothetical protein